MASPPFKITKKKTKKTEVKVTKNIEMRNLKRKVFKPVSNIYVTVLQTTH